MADKRRRWWPLSRSGVGLGDQFQIDHGDVHHDLAGMLEIDRDALADSRLDLAEAPVGLVRMAHQTSRKKARHMGLIHAVCIPWSGPCPAALAIPKRGLNTPLESSGRHP